MGPAGRIGRRWGWPDKDGDGRTKMGTNPDSHVCSAHLCLGVSSYTSGLVSVSPSQHPSAKSTLSSQSLYYTSMKMTQLLSVRGTTHHRHPRLSAMASKSMRLRKFSTVRYIFHGKVEYLVCWKGYGVEEDEWRPSQDIRSSK